jgi:N-acyl-phosphatidylethanolamine-hydrolysing phospholipase D
MPTTIEDLPAIDAIILSHNHFDHTSYGDLQVLNARHAPHVFAGLENGPLLRSIGFPPERIHCLDWWDRSSLALALPAAGDVTGMGKAVDTTVEITCTPAQHQANRSFYDRWRTLWASWAVKGSTGQSVYFGGDTGYRTVREGEDEDAVPRCPAFREIGEKLGEFDLALLPIGCVGFCMSHWLPRL